MRRQPVDVRISLHKDSAVIQLGQQHGLICDPDRRADGDHGEELGGIIRVQPDASMAAKTIYAPRRCSTMNTKRGHGQPDPISAKRIVWTGFDPGLDLPTLPR